MVVGIVLVGLPVGMSWGQIVTDTVRNRAYDVHRTKERRVVPYPFLREADVFWEKRIWRDILVKEKMNLIFSYPKRPFSQIVWEAVSSGELTAYEASTDIDPDGDFVKPLSAAEVQERFVKDDTVFVTDPVTGEEIMRVEKRELFKPEYIIKYRIKEDWIFDKRYSIMYVRIISVAPYYQEFDREGNLKGVFPAFWLYYPDLRHVLVKEEAFNVNNDAHRFSWDDVFEMRLFGSVIVKESNVYDRRIEDYLTGLDALYESQRIQNRIIDYEQFLWSY